MAKTKDELNELRAEAEALTKKLTELTDDELSEVTGGMFLVGRGSEDIVTPLPSRGDPSGAKADFLTPHKGADTARPRIFDLLRRPDRKSDSNDNGPTLI